MSMVTEHMKAKKILTEVLEEKITSYDEVLKKLGSVDSEFYKLWARNIWELHTTEAPSADLSVRLPSKVPQKKDWKITTNKSGDVYIVNCYTVEEAYEVVANYLNDDGTEDYAYYELKDTFQRKEIKLKV